jgi:hydroxymethylglutaryl-CoA synthase
MAATAVLRLIRSTTSTRQRIGFLGLGTESSTDNSAGAVIVKGMVNPRSGPSSACHRCPGLRSAGVQARLPRRRVRPEGGGPLPGPGRPRPPRHRGLLRRRRVRPRHLRRADPGRRRGGHAGGGIAPLLALELACPAAPPTTAGRISASRSCASCSRRHRSTPSRGTFRCSTASTPPPATSTRCWRRCATCSPPRGRRPGRGAAAPGAAAPGEFMRDLSATFLHRPYQRMAETGLIMSYLLALAIGDGDDQRELARYAEAAEVDGRAGHRTDRRAGRLRPGGDQR